MDLGLNGKRAIVIGGTKGLGLAVCEGLAAEGVNLLIFARGQEQLAVSGADLEHRFRIQVLTEQGDISSEADVDRLAARAQSLEDVQILIVNTPRPPSPMRDFLDENDPVRWDAAFRDQLHGALLVLRKLTPILLRTGWGRVVAITSASVKQPMPRHAVSTIFRAGVQAAVKHLAMETAALGVTVNAVAPATILTPTFGTYHDLEERIQRTPVKRMGRPEELAATVAFLCSVQAAFITGELIQIDGGATLALC